MLIAIINGDLDLISLVRHVSRVIVPGPKFPIPVLFSTACQIGCLTPDNRGLIGHPATAVEGLHPRIMPLRADALKIAHRPQRFGRPLGTPFKQRRLLRLPRRRASGRSPLHLPSRIAAIAQSEVHGYMKEEKEENADPFPKAV